MPVGRPAAGRPGGEFTGRGPGRGPAGQPPGRAARCRRAVDPRRPVPEGHGSARSVAPKGGRPGATEPGPLRAPPPGRSLSRPRAHARHGEGARLMSHVRMLRAAGVSAAVPTGGLPATAGPAAARTVSGAAATSGRLAAASACACSRPSDGGRGALPSARRRGLRGVRRVPSGAGRHGRGDLRDRRGMRSTVTAGEGSFRLRRGCGRGRRASSGHPRDHPCGDFPRPYGRVKLQGCTVCPLSSSSR